MDLTSGYFPKDMTAEDIEKIVFTSKRSCYAFKRILLGLSGSAIVVDDEKISPIH